MRKLDAQHIKNNVVKKLAVGEPQTSIARQVGVGQSTISRFAEKEEVVKQKKLVKIAWDKFFAKEIDTTKFDKTTRRNRFWGGLFKELHTNCIGLLFQTYPYNPHSLRKRDELPYSAKKT